MDSRAPLGGLALASLAFLAAAPLSSAPREYVERREQLRSYLSRRADEVPEALRAPPPPGFCSSSEHDVSRDGSGIRDTIALWKSVQKASKGRLALTLARWSRLCEFSLGAISRSAVVLETMYWNGVSDLAGLETADVAMLRNAFFELAMAQRAIQLTAESELNEAFGSESCDDFLALPLKPSHGFLENVGKALNALEPEKSRVVAALRESLQQRAGDNAILGDDMLAVISSKEDRDALAAFYGELQLLRAKPALLAERHGGWKRLMKACGGDPVRAFRVIGTVAGLRTWPMDKIATALASRGRLSPEQLRAAYQGVNAYFLMNELDERSALPGPGSHETTFHFFYPPGETSTDWKLYHWYANAHLGCGLAKKGFGLAAIEYGVRRLAMAYEGINLTRDASGRRAMGVDPRANPILEGYDDVALNAAGGSYGARACARFR
jgi:hypothetical protein